MNTFSSSSVASYCSASGLIGVIRSTTLSATLWKLPALSSQVWSVNVLDSMTSVAPSQRPTELPMYVSIGGGSTAVMWIERVVPMYSEAIRMNSGLWTIWSGNGMYMTRGTPGR